MGEAGSYLYESEIDWSREKEGTSRGPQLPPIPVGAPPEFKGRAGNWTPEHLFVASVNTCLMLTLLAIAENSKINLVSYSATASGKLEKVQGAGYQVTEILVKPKVVVASEEDLRRMPRILEKAKEGCFISNSIKSVVKFEPEVSHQKT